VQENLDRLWTEFEGQLASCATLRALEEIKVRYLGRKGPVQALMKELRTAPPEQRPELGQRINSLKEKIAATCQQREDQFQQAEESERLKKEWIDITLPGRSHRLGGVHPVAHMLDELLDIFIEMGFSVQYGPEIESDYYNFEALNFGADHPARDMHDTYYISPKIVLRTHTTATGIRVMEHNNPPIRIVAPGRCFRNEDITARSHVFFHQIDGFYIDEQVSFANLLHTLETFLQRLFGQQVQLRFRASYFPFVEPGLEVDVGCMACQGKGCPVCKHSGWLEVLGAGMIHPEVMRAGGIDPEQYSGFAWGLGIERLVMLRYGIPDIRLLTDNDLRLLSQFHAA
jgi:phenylalanyl-tRNA synthetase alpha chain